MKDHIHHILIRLGKYKFNELAWMLEKMSGNKLTPTALLTNPSQGSKTVPSIHIQECSSSVIVKAVSLLSWSM